MTVEVCDSCDSITDALSENGLCSRCEEVRASLIPSIARTRKRRARAKLRELIGSKEWTVEDTLAEILKRAGFVEGVDFVRQYPVERYRLDFALVDQKVDIECDGDYHRETKQRLHDAERDKRLMELGWTVIRIQYGEIVRNPEASLRKVRRLKKGLPA